MTRNDLIDIVAAKVNMTKKDTGIVMDAVFEAISEELVNDGKVYLVGFGTFEVAERAAREGRNPQDGAPIMIEASRAVKFKAAKALKDVLNS